MSLSRISAAALLTALVGFASPASAEPRFALPPLEVVDIAPARAEVVVFDETRGRYARLAVGQRYGEDYRLIRIHRDRIVLRRIGTDTYFVLPVQSASSRDAIRRDENDEPAPRDPYAESPSHERAQREHQSRGVLDPQLYAPRRDRQRHPYRGAEREDRRLKNPFAAPERDRRAEPPAPRPEERDRPQRPIHPFDGPTGDERRSDARRGEDERSRRPLNPYAPSSVDRDAGRSAAAQPSDPRRPAPEPPRPALEVSRAQLYEVFADLDDLGRDVSIRPEGDALRVTSVVAGSYLHRLGLRRGDLVVRVAGRRVDSPEAVAALYAHLARADRVKVELIRDGRDVELRYRLVP